MPGTPASSSPPANPEIPSQDRAFREALTASNIVRMTWLLIASTTLSLILAVGYLLQGDFSPVIVRWQTADIGGSLVFLVLFLMARRGSFSPAFRWGLGPAYFAFWLVLMLGYYFNTLHLYGENITFAAGAVTPALIILLPPRYFVPLLAAYFVTFFGIHLWAPGMNTGRNAETIAASIVNGALAVIVGFLAAWFSYFARRANFEKEQLLIRRNADLRRAESNLSAILENIPFQAWLKDLEGRYLAANREFAAANHRSQQEIIGLRAADLYPPERADLYDREDARIIRDGTREHEEQAVEFPNGMVWYEVFKSPVLDENGDAVGTAGLARDVTDRKRMEAQVLAANRAKSEFLAAMSHEIRTPLNSVIGYAQLLHELPLEHRQMEYVDSILTSGRILLGVINDILDFSRIEAGQLALSPVSFPLGPLLESTLRMFDPQAASKGVALRLEIDPELPDELLADPMRIEQILVNLLSNAVKFTEHGSVALRANRRGETLRLQVLDTGIGILPGKLEALFQPFSQVDASFARRYGGTGLGLVITRRLSELMGGSVDVQSRHGEGSTFTVTLPLVRGSASDAPATLDGPGKDTDLSALRVLVVEDNLSNRRLLSAILRRWRITPALAEGGLVALDLFLEQTFDVILMDVQMPGMDGLETTRRIRATEAAHPNRPPAHIIALTALAMSGDAERCIEAGMNDYVTKPIRVTALEQALRSHRTRGR